jgi:carbon starvation protein
VSLILIIIAIVVFSIAYVTYGAWLSKKWGVDLSKKTPAHEFADGVDYVPAKVPVLMGHHFASIAGAGPIIGPIVAAMFGWLPVFLWLIVGSIFFGGVHDYGSLFASIRHDGKSISYVIEQNIGRTGKKLISVFSWLTLVLVIAAFANVIVKTFVAVPSVATISILFIFLAIAFGIAVNRMNVPLVPATIVGVALLGVCIWFGLNNPITLSFNSWYAIILVYIFIASVAPVWILLQPRDYLNSYILYAMIGGAVLGLLVYRPNLELPAVTGFTVNGSMMFPILFVTVACGAISGFHSLIASGTSSKQVDREGDAKIIGYGSMLIEGVLAVIALITAAYIGADKFGELMSAGGPANVFADGVGQFMTGFGVSKAVGKSFVSLAISAFALTSLDSGTRIGRFIFQEFFDNSDSETGKKSNSILTNKYFATIVTVACGAIMGIAGYEKVWPVFGTSNNLLASIALLTLATWLKKEGKDNRMITIPMTFMFLVTMTAIVLLVRTNLLAGNLFLAGIGVLLNHGLH